LTCCNPTTGCCTLDQDTWTQICSQMTLSDCAAAGGTPTTLDCSDPNSACSGNGVAWFSKQSVNDNTLGCSYYGMGGGCVSGTTLDALTAFSYGGFGWSPAGDLSCYGMGSNCGIIGPTSPLDPFVLSTKQSCCTDLDKKCGVCGGIVSQGNQFLTTQGNVNASNYWTAFWECVFPQYASQVPGHNVENNTQEGCIAAMLASDNVYGYPGARHHPGDTFCSYMTTDIVCAVDAPVVTNTGTYPCNAPDGTYIGGNNQVTGCWTADATFNFYYHPKYGDDCTSWGSCNGDPTYFTNCNFSTASDAENECINNWGGTWIPA